MNSSDIKTLAEHVKTITRSPVVVVLACNDRALLRIAGGFGAAVLALSVSLGALGALVQGPAVLLELVSFATHWLPTGRVLLLGRSSSLVPVGTGAPGDDRGAERENKQELFKY